MATRYLIFTVPVTASTASALMQALLRCYGDPNVSEIIIGFSSSGGGVPEGVMLHTLIAASPKPVTMHAIGNIESIAITIYLGASRRLAASGTLFMFHPMSATYPAGVTLTLPFLRQVQQKLQEDEARLQRIWTDRTGMASEEMTDLFVIDSMRDANWGRDHGFVHKTAEFVVPSGADLVWFTA